MTRRTCAVIVACFTLLGCAPEPTITDPPTSILAKAPCQSATRCVIRIFFTSAGKPAVDIDEIQVDNQNAHIWWVLMPKGCDFGTANGVLLKDPNGDPRGEFHEKYVADENEVPQPVGRRGKLYHWRDKYSFAASYKYEINFQCYGKPYHLDPTIKNG